MDGPHAGDVVIRPSGPQEVGIFILGADQWEHPLRAFSTFTEALTHAKAFADHSSDVWQSRSRVDPLTLVVSGCPRGQETSADTLGRVHRSATRDGTVERSPGVRDRVA